MKYSVFATVLMAFTVVGSANAQDKSKEVGSGPNPFSDCGIGAALFSENKTLAVTSNVIWDIGTTAVTSATASPETCSGKNVTAATFILNTYDNLIEDTARGEGEHLVALMNILEVEQTAKQDVVNALRAQVAQHVIADEYNTASKIEKSQMFFSAVVNAVNEA
ncbi:MAG: DUF3015 domain-containing protein [Paraglaciecola sp.]|uniref:DUF3015 family protein n=1 Tax=Alteromonadaceae TaxID=72275 RepID=UPI00273E1D38|nr:MULTISPECIES: DUF3015 family protein [Alteromonadaceae]MDP4946179.1 DUF3015 domain-containing protein [Alishewanella sp.]MDP5206457.1 DUF3015 family protein [Alishewanella sp. SMS9]MDP5030694.1 DUF3015 domain-containing protein [Paraglaciecola sp.]MDP5034946.1 DUF3015 domain-containing protein [Alishewanella sp.]MDP5132294.1 DUF3015 domain-containing protein [Paraglaciecola sp.]